MNAGRNLLLCAAAVAAAFVPAAAAKDFRPGDLRVCSASRCVPVTNGPALAAVGAFYYGPRLPRAAPAPSKRARYVELRFTHGYVTGVAAGAHLDRFLSFGVNLGQFRARTWYRIPAPLSVELRRIARTLPQRRLPTGILDRSH